MKTFRKGGIHPDAMKLTAGSPLVTVPPAGELKVMLSQSIGAPAKPVVKPGDHVEAGQMVAESAGFVSAPVHSPVNGTVKRIEPARNPQGMWQDCVVILADEDPGEPLPRPRTPEEIAALSPADIVSIVADAGIVGLGGATFPTRVKLSVPPGKKADTVIINGAECEPYLTCDDHLMQHCPDEIVAGLRYIMKATSAPRGIIGIEENKPEALAAMRRATEAFPEISVEALKKKYPQGGEKQLIYAITGKFVPEGGLPIDCGVIVDNVATAYAIAEAVEKRLPLTRRIVTVTGPSLPNGGGNFLVADGTPVSRLLEAAGGLPADTGKVIAGGPMMGRAMSNLEAPSTKGLSGIVVLPENESLRRPAEECVRCATCVSKCPMGLEPYLLMILGENSRWDDMASHHIMNCIECGCCTYICPSSRPILDFIKLGKQQLRKKPK